MMRKEEVDRFALRRPFEPFEVRLVDGQKFRLRNVEEFVVGRYDMGVLMHDGTIAHLSLGLISTIRPIPSARARRIRRRGRAS